MLKANRHPLSGTFELTGRCNLSCKMCLVRVDRKRMAELNLRERTGEEWIDMARQAAAAGTIYQRHHGHQLRDGRLAKKSTPQNWRNHVRRFQ